MSGPEEKPVRKPVGVASGSEKALVQRVKPQTPTQRLEYTPVENQRLLVESFKALLDEDALHANAKNAEKERVFKKILTIFKERIEKLNPESPTDAELLTELKNVFLRYASSELDSVYYHLASYYGNRNKEIGGTISPRGNLVERFSEILDIDDLLFEIPVRPKDHNPHTALVPIEQARTKGTAFLARKELLAERLRKVAYATLSQLATITVDVDAYEHPNTSEEARHKIHSDALAKLVGLRFRRRLDERLYQIARGEDLHVDEDEIVEKAIAKIAEYNAQATSQGHPTYENLPEGSIQDAGKDIVSKTAVMMRLRAEAEADIRDKYINSLDNLGLAMERLEERISGESGLLDLEDRLERLRKEVDTYLTHQQAGTLKEIPTGGNVIKTFGGYVNVSSLPQRFDTVMKAVYDEEARLELEGGESTPRMEVFNTSSDIREAAKEFRRKTVARNRNFQRLMSRFVVPVGNAVLNPEYGKQFHSDKHMYALLVSARSFLEDALSPLLSETAERAAGYLRDHNNAIHDGTDTQRILDPDSYNRMHYALSVSEYLDAEVTRALDFIERASEKFSVSYLDENEMEIYELAGKSTTELMKIIQTEHTKKGRGTHTTIEGWVNAKVDKKLIEVADAAKAFKQRYENVRLSPPAEVWKPLVQAMRALDLGWGDLSSLERSINELLKSEQLANMAAANAESAKDQTSAHEAEKAARELYNERDILERKAEWARKAFDKQLSIVEDMLADAEQMPLPTGDEEELEGMPAREYLLEALPLFLSAAKQIVDKGPRSEAIDKIQRWMDAAKDDSTPDDALEKIIEEIAELSQNPKSKNMNEPKRKIKRPNPKSVNIQLLGEKGVREAAERNAQKAQDIIRELRNESAWLKEEIDKLRTENEVLRSKESIPATPPAPVQMDLEVIDGTLKDLSTDIATLFRLQLPPGTPPEHRERVKEIGNRIIASMSELEDVIRKSNN